MQTTTTIENNDKVFMLLLTDQEANYFRSTPGPLMRTAHELATQADADKLAIKSPNKNILYELNRAAIASAMALDGSKRRPKTSKNNARFIYKVDRKSTPVTLLCQIGVNEQSDYDANPIPYFQRALSLAFKKSALKVLFSVANQRTIGALLVTLYDRQKPEQTPEEPT